MQQLVPQAGQFPQAAAIIARLHAMIINISADSGVDARFQAVCDSVDDANLLGAAMQAGIMYRRYQEAQGNPSLAKTLDQVKVIAHRRPSENRIARESGRVVVADSNQGLCFANVIEVLCFSSGEAQHSPLRSLLDAGLRALPSRTIDAGKI